MADEKWQDIFSAPVPYDPYAPAPIITPRILGTPECESHCSGKHSVDSVLRCPKCGTVGYQIVMHEYRHQDGHNFCEVVSVNGSEKWRSSIKQPICRDCGVELSRD